MSSRGEAIIAGYRIADLSIESGSNLATLAGRGQETSGGLEIGASERGSTHGANLLLKITPPRKIGLVSISRGSGERREVVSLRRNAPTGIDSRQLIEPRRSCCSFVVASHRFEITYLSISTYRAQFADRVIHHSSSPRDPRSRFEF